MRAGQSLRMNGQAKSPQRPLPGSNVDLALEKGLWSSEHPLYDRTTSLQAPTQHGSRSLEAPYRLHGFFHTRQIGCALRLNPDSDKSGSVEYSRRPSLAEYSNNPTHVAETFSASAAST